MKQTSLGDRVSFKVIAPTPADTLTAIPTTTGAQSTLESNWSNQNKTVLIIEAFVIMAITIFFGGNTFKERKIGMPVRNFGLD